MPEEAATQPPEPDDPDGAAVEPGDGEEDEAAPSLPPEPEPEPEPAHGAVQVTSPQDVDKVVAKLEAEAARHTRRVAELMGDDATELVPCPLCWSAAPGFRFPIPPDGEQLAAVLDAIGQGHADYAKADDARACEPCKGLGLVTTGSLVPEHATKLCSGCGGTGWVGVAGPAPAAPVALVQPVTAAQGHEHELPSTDFMGRPLGHVDYGKLPQYASEATT